MLWFRKWIISEQRESGAHPVQVRFRTRGSNNIDRYYRVNAFLGTATIVKEVTGGQEDKY